MSKHNHHNHNRDARRKTQQRLHLLDEISLPNGQIRRVLYEGECLWTLQSDAVVVHQEPVMSQGSVLVGVGAAVPQLKSHMRYRLVWHIDMAADGKPIGEARERWVFRIPADRAYLCLPMTLVGEGDGAQWMSAQKAAERERALAGAAREH